MTASTDYERITQVIEYITANYTYQPTLADIAAHAHLSEFHLQRLFTRWAGVSPKRFIQILTAEHARRQLIAQQTTLNTSYNAGLSSTGRLHDLFITLHAVTPGEVQSGGAGLTIHYGLHETPFGSALLLTTPRGITGLDFPDPTTVDQALARHRRLWPHAEFIHNSAHTARFADQIFGHEPHPREPLALYVRGTNFQVQVWQALLQIPSGQVASYQAIAKQVCTARASRAVGAAVGANPVAWLIPCHRVIRSSGALGGYLWGLPRKQAMLVWEQLPAASLAVA